MQPPLPACRTALAFVELAGPRDLLAAFEAIRSQPYPWLLESSLELPGHGRFGFAGADPYLVVRATGSRVVLEPRRPVRPGLAELPRSLAGDPFAVLRSLLPPAPASDPEPGIPFLGGAVGCFGYELAATIERLVFRPPDTLATPDLCFLFVDRLLAYDTQERRLVAVGLGMAAGEAEAARRARAAAASLAREAALPGRACEATAVEPGLSGPPTETLLAGLDARSHFDAAGYAETVLRVKQHILRGDLYQANLTQRIDLPFDGDPFDLYRVLRRLNPAPFAAFLGLPEVTVVGSSPERFLRVTTDRRVESRPIKGTRPRGATPAEDEALRKELEQSEKDRAENLMIVDLVRNDLGRVCETGSVHVPSLFAVESYASVHHLVSVVQGVLQPDRDALDAVRAAFPPGSMTGAPKISAMRILARLEPVRRGIYAGALGSLDLRGGADLCVVIRTLFVAGGRAHLHVGGAVVADSDPAGEWRESLDKARALVLALGQAAAGTRDRPQAGSPARR
jgi:para-aminobenzoate synthetase component 1